VKHVKRRHPKIMRCAFFFSFSRSSSLLKRLLFSVRNSVVSHPPKDILLFSQISPCLLLYSSSHFLFFAFHTFPLEFLRCSDMVRRSGLAPGEYTRDTTARCHEALERQGEWERPEVWGVVKGGKRSHTHTHSLSLSRTDKWQENESGPHRAGRPFPLI
jgi:hypothetical protein